jgi:hypothetical protein
VRDKLGLELKPAKRKVEILVVEKVTPEGKPTSTNSAP